MVRKFQKEIVVSSISQKTAYLYDYLKSGRAKNPTLLCLLGVAKHK